MKLALYRLYQFTIMWPLMLAATILTALVTIIGCTLGGGRWWGYWPAVLWARVMCWLTMVRVRVSGRDKIDPATSYVFVCNHQGAYDIFSIYGWLGHNFRWMMKAPLRKIPLVGFACERAQQIFVDNRSRGGVRHTMGAAEKILRRGMSIVVFPEGARSWDGHMRRFKRGAYTLATEFNMPVVPVTIDGSFSVMPRYSMLPRYGTIRIIIHSAIFPPEGGYDLSQLMQHTYDAINSGLPEAYQAPTSSTREE